MLQPPAEPHGYGKLGRPAALGHGYVVRFRTADSSVVRVRIELGGCLGVEATSSGAPWGWDKWDPTNATYREIQQDTP